MDIGSVSTAITIVAGAIFVFAFVLYNKDIIAGKAKPSFVSWLLFAIITGINFFSFRDMTGDWVKTVCAFTDFAGCTATFGLLIYRRAHGKRLDWTDKTVLSICACAASVWVFFHSSLSANVIIQTCYLLAFFPTLKNARVEPGSEPSGPWLIWSVAWILTIFVVYLRWQGAWTDMLNPVSLFALHFMCGLFALRKPQAAHT